jgi:hypothetical protein
LRENYFIRKELLVVSIRIVNFKTYKPLHKNELLMKVDRSSMLGNPYFMNDESKRDEVCDKYEKYFFERLEVDEQFAKAVQNIIDCAKAGFDIALCCWCAPKRCHAETIKRYVESKLK